MGFKIKLHNISVTNDFKVFYRKGRTPGSSTIQSGDWGINGGIFVGDFISSVNSVDIDIENIEYGSQYWVKILDVVTGSYIIENVYIHEFEFYRFCETCCDLSGGTATFIEFDKDCTFTGGSAIFGANTPTPTPTPTPTATPTPTPTPTPSCGIQLISVNNVSGTTWEYNFVSGELCYTTILEYSTNNVTWTGFGGGCNSPRYCNIGTQVGTIYFRISQYCPPNGPIVSNTISYTLPTPTPTPTPIPPTPTSNWLILNQDCGGSATLNTVSVNSVSINSFTPLTSTSYVTRTNPNGVNYGNNNTIMVGVSNIPSGTARIYIYINNGAREYYTDFTTNPFPTINNVLINSGDIVSVRLVCHN